MAWFLSQPTILRLAAKSNKPSIAWNFRLASKPREYAVDESVNALVDDAVGDSRANILAELSQTLLCLL